jgi:prevent-host-death family protein
MCYNSCMTTIGIRDLRQRASEYLRRVKAGETFTVTERGIPVAELRPLSRHESVIERLEREGRLTPANGSLDDFLEKHPPLPPKPGDPLLSEILIQMREEETR